MGDEAEIEFASYFINIGQGDGAIHVLFKRASGKKIVLKAILLDGGKPNSEWTAQPTLWNTIKQIERYYECDGEKLPGLLPRRKLRFDAIIVSHWDEDHFGGVAGLLLEDIDKQYADWHNATPQPPNFFLSRAKYDDNGDPVTCFYAPNWKDKPKPVVDKKPGKKPGKKPPKQSAPTTLSGGARFPEDLKKLFVVDDQGVEDGQVSEYEGNLHIKAKYVDAAGHEHTDFCKAALRIKIGATAILGRDFLKDFESKTPKPADVVNPARLLQLNEPFAIGWPGFYCVATNRRILGPKKGVNVMTTWKNKSSICCMLIWRSADGPHVSLYSGGDADMSLERKIVEWSAIDAANSKDGRGIRTVKLSHHGAVSSNPETFFTKWDPMNVIASAGNNTYGHPRWEVLALMNTWLQAQPFEKPSVRPLWLLNWPGYFQKHKNGEHLTVNDSGFKTSAACYKLSKAWITALNTARLAKNLFSREECWVDEYSTWRKSQGKDEPKREVKLTWAFDWVEEKLTFLCANTGTTECGSFWGKWGTTKKGSVGNILHLKVISSPSVHDGSVTVVYANNTWRQVPWVERTKRTLWKMTDSIWKTKSSSSWSNLQQDESTEPMSLSWDVVSEGDLSDTESWTSSAGKDSRAVESMSYLYGALLDEPPQGPMAFLVDRTNPTSRFINALGWQAFALADVPEKGKTSLIASEDQWVAWFKVALGIAGTALKFIPSSWPLQDTTPAFTVDLELPGVQLVFDTGHASIATGCRQEMVDSVLREQGVLLFGLSAVSPPETTLTFRQVASSFEIPDEGVAKMLGSMKLQPEAGNGQRNCIWFAPDTYYKTTLRMRFKVLDDQISPWLTKCLPDLRIDDIALVARKQVCTVARSTCDEMTAVGSFTLVLKCTITPRGKGPLVLDAALTVNSDNVSLSMTYNGSGKQPTAFADTLREGLLTWIGSSLGFDDFDLDKWLQPAETSSGLLQSVIPRSLRVVIPTDEAGKLQAPACLVFSLQTNVGSGDSKDGKATRPIFFFEFGWAKGCGTTFKGWIWTDSGVNDVRRALPEWEDYEAMLPILDNDRTGLAGRVDLKSLFDVNDLPEGIPSEVTEASIELDKDGILFRGSLRCTKPSSGKVPGLSLDMLSLQAGYRWATGKGAFFMSMEAEILLFPGGHEVDTEDPIVMTGRMSYIAKTWKFEAAVGGLSVKHLAGFWSDETYKGVDCLLGKLAIDELSLVYQYEGGQGSSFDFTGVMSMGELQLGIDFEHTGQGWTFLIGLAAESSGESGKCTIGTVLASFLESPPELPTAIWNIEIGQPKSGSELLRFLCTEVEVERNGKPTKMIIFQGSIHLSNITLSFIQWRERDWDARVPSKRVIKAAISDIGAVDAPLVGKIDQPFDQLFYMWVQDGTGKNSGPGPNGKPGILKAEYDMMNEILSDKDKLFHREIKAKYEPGDLVLEAGSHIIVVCKDDQGISKAVLDYAFAKPGPKSLEVEEDFQMIYFADGPPADEKGKSMAPLRKSVGPLSVQNIGLEYKDNKLGIMLDATFMMGPISLSLLGFGFKYPFGGGERAKPVLPEPEEPEEQDIEGMEESDDEEVELVVRNDDDLCHLDGFDPSKVEVTLSGLMVAFDKPPLTVAGGFQHSVIDNCDCYAGGLIVGFKVWMISAVGVYSQYPAKSVKDDPDTKRFTMVFIILKVEGPLFSVGFADISGVTGGFGVNSAVKPPTVETVTSFPFVASRDVGPDQSVIKTLGNMMATGWFTPRDGAFWVAAGLKVSAIQMLSVDAVAVFEFNPDVRLGIYGVAVFDAPSLKSPVKFAHVELGLICVLDIQAGVFKVEAQLSPSSYILHPSCHLTGGFAFYSWFKSRDGALAGDWVLTIGGYHQAFDVPSQYPKPPRLGISWSLDSALSITGEAYFAVTPRLCMGGGRLHAALTLGSLSAFFDAFLDFLINYKPFHFMAVGKISVGVRYALRLKIVTIRINVEIGATLTVTGPPIAGTVHVDFWVFGFDINFGGGRVAPPPALPVGDFVKLVLESEASPGTGFTQEVTGLARASKSTATTAAILFSCIDGLVPKTAEKEGNTTDDKPEKELWVVRGGVFCFLVSFKFPVENLTMNDKRPGRYRDPDSKLPENPVYDFPEKGIYAQPMHLTEPIKSSVEVEITKDEKNAIVLREPPSRQPERGEWRIERETKPVQKSIWGQYNAVLDPSGPWANTRSLLADNSPMPSLVTGVYLTPPAPVLAEDKIPKFNMTSDLQQSVFGKDEMPRFPPNLQSSRAWSPRDSASASLDAIRRTWKNPKNRPDRVAELWSKRLGFSEVLSGARPEALISRMETMVPALPMIAVGTTS